MQISMIPLFPSPPVPLFSELMPSSVCSVFHKNAACSNTHPFPLAADVFCLCVSMLGLYPAINQLPAVPAYCSHETFNSNSSWQGSGFLFLGMTTSPSQRALSFLFWNTHQVSPERWDCSVCRSIPFTVRLLLPKSASEAPQVPLPLMGCEHALSTVWWHRLSVYKL